MDSVVAKRIERDLLNQNVGGWQIVDRINAGKSAVVLKGIRDGEVGAVKIFDPEMVERYGKSVQLARIERELMLRGKFHPNLVRILDGGECLRTGYLFVAMEFLESDNLASKLTIVPRDRIWPLISQIANAARFLESLELAHRDIKPENIAISNDFQKAVLLDLGVVRPFGAIGLTDEEQRAFVGTLQYSPPEFLVREEQDSVEGWRAVTFYQLGAVLHDMIMGKRIFEEFTAPYALLARAVERVNPKVMAADLPADLIVMASSCLLKDPKLRLALVKWEDFDPPEFKVGAELDDPQARIRRRRAIAQQSNVLVDSLNAEQKARSASRILNKLQASVQSAIHQECIGSDLFPPMEIHDAPRHDGVSARFQLNFAASTDHALSNVLSVFIVVELLDENAEAARISYGAAMARQAIEFQAANENHFCELYKGVYNQVAVSEKVKSMLYRMFDLAQQDWPSADFEVGFWLTQETDSKEISS